MANGLLPLSDLIAPRMNRPRGEYSFQDDTLIPYLQKVFSGQIAEQGMKRYGDAVRAGLLGDYSQLGEVAGDAIGGGIKLAGGLLGTFGGKGAKTADLDMLKIAQEASEKGMPKERVFDATGWFKGKDGKWRFEIDDALSKYSNAAKAVESWDAADGIKMVGNNPNMSLLRHEQLQSAYPETSKIKSAGRINFGKTQGSYKSPEYAGDTGLIEINTLANNPHSTALHELQHAIQQREGFARGGNPDNAAQLGLAGENAQFGMARQAYESAKGLDGSISTDDLYAALMDLPTTKKEAVPWESLSRKEQVKWLEAGRNLAYKRLAGEVEARNVQTRMGLLGDDRRMLPPWLTEDVPFDRQIVRYGDETSMSLPDDFPKDWYHGTDKDFDVFSLNMDGSGSGLPTGAIWFSDAFGSASDFGDTIKKTSLNLKNPFIVEDSSQWTRENIPKFLRQAIASGHDGLFARNVRDGAYTSNLAAVFDPNLIKILESINLSE